MIVDVHAHVFNDGWLPAWANHTLAHMLATVLPSVEAEDELLQVAWDVTGEKVIAEMDAAGVDKLLVLPLDWGLAEQDGRTHEAKHPIDQLNRAHYNLVRKYPGRLLFGVAVDPRRPNAIEILEMGVKELGAKVLKLYPAAGFYPNDHVVYPLYAACQEQGVPVLFHTGPVADLRGKFCHPIYFDDVAADFPDLKIICSHAGHGWWRDMLAIARVRRNMYLDISGWRFVVPHPRILYPAVREMMDLVPGRVMWGSDRWGLPNVMVDCLKPWTGMPKAVGDMGISFSEQEMSAFLGGTAAQLLAL